MRIMYEQQIKEIAERLHGLRDALELTQEQAAEKLGIEAEKYVAYESGNCDIPMSFLYSVAKGFNVDMQTLISGETLTRCLTLWCAAARVSW